MILCLKFARNIYLQKSYWLEACKLRLVTMVVFTTLIGYFAAIPSQINWYHFFLLNFAVFVSACGAHLLNQYFERKSDALMDRTKNRPLPSGKLEPAVVFYTGWLIGLTGCFMLIFLNPLTSILCLLTLLSYVFLYTPLKKISAWNTWIGAIPGTLPIFIGFFAVNNELNLTILILAGILFIWQIPHFLALAWRYRVDYQKANLKMLTSLDESGNITAWVILLHTIILFFLTFLPYWLITENLFYILAIALINLIFMKDVLGFFFGKKDFFAKKLFLASLWYLPLIYFCYISFIIL